MECRAKGLLVDGLQEIGMRRNVLCGLIALAIASCGDDTRNAGRSKDEARRVADAYLKSARLRIPVRRIIVEDEGAEWMVVYYGRDPGTGAVGRIWVDKKRMQVVGRVFEQ